MNVEPTLCDNNKMAPVLVSRMPRVPSHNRVKFCQKLETQWIVEL